MQENQSARQFYSQLCFILEHQVTNQSGKIRHNWYSSNHKFQEISQKPVNQLLKKNPYHKFVNSQTDTLQKLIFV